MTSPKRLTISPAGDPARPALESLIRKAFLRQHLAHVEHFMPELVSLWGPGGAPVGVVGVRAADLEPLYLEHYLDSPVEQVLSTSVNRSVGREEIVEVGSLAGVTCRAACRLVAALPPLLLSQGRRWIVFTATDTVRGVLARLGAPLIEVATARSDRAPAQDRWGRYYQSDPRVMAGYLPELA